MRQLVFPVRRSRAIAHQLARALAVAGLGLSLLAANVSAAPDYHLLKNIRTAAASSSPSWFTAMSGYVLFFATEQHGTELWRTDGTGAHTTLVKNIRPGSASSISIDSEMVRLGNVALFTANDGQNGIELWRSDGTPNGTRMVRNIFAGNTSSSPHQFMRSGNRVFFVVANGTHGDELWVTNGTHDGTKKASPIHPTGPVEISQNNWAPFNGGLAFAANDGHNGSEPWFSNGTQPGTFKLGDINSGSGGSQPFDFTAVNGRLYFAASDPTHGQQLWTYEPTGNALAMLQINGGNDASVGGLVRVGNAVYFSATGSSGSALWRATGTTLKGIKIIDPTGASSPTEITPVGATIYFHANDGTHGNELWKSDGTTVHTQMVKDVFPNNVDDGGSNPAYLRNVGGLLMYEARDATHGYSLWRSDGTPSGTQMVKDLAPGPGNFGFNGDAVMGKFFFVLGDDGIHGEEMWQSDGTKNGTFVLDINPGPNDSNINQANAANGIFYMGADDGTHGNEPWIVKP